MKFNTAFKILTTLLASSAYVQAQPGPKGPKGPKGSRGSSLFTMTNAAGGNEVLMYSRNPDNGSISFIGSFATGKRLG
jgi:hypothetical protein